MRSLKSFLWTLLAGLMVSAVSPQALACTACFGKSDSNMARGMNMGIFALLLMIVSVLCGVAGFFVYLAKRGSQLEENAREQHAHLAARLSENRTNA
jgi:hypothetical protein